MTMSPLAARLISDHDWRTSLQILAALAAIVMIPVALLVRRFFFRPAVGRAELGVSLQRQNLLLAMAAPCARASSLPQITSESTPLEPTWMLNPQSTAAMTLSRPTRLA